MSENFIRHLVAFSGGAIVLLAFLAGYLAGKSGWWWVVLGVVFVYASIYKLMSPGGHH